MTRLCLFGYFGGKYRLAPKLIPMFPSHHTYVEVFGGAAHILLLKERSSREVFNDLNPDIHNLFSVLQDAARRADFIHMAEWSPYACQLRDELFNSKPPADPVKRAWRWWYLQSTGYRGTIGGATMGFSKTQNLARRLIDRVDQLPEVARRLEGVQLRCADWADVIDEFDHEDTFFYLDPPYLPETRRGGEYPHEMTRDDHERMLNRLCALKAQAMLSGYPSALYDDALGGWTRREFKATSSVASRRRASGLQGEDRALDQQRTEVVWMNYETDLRLF